MSYHIIFAPSFERAIDRQIDYWLTQRVAPETVDRWFGRLHERITATADYPRLYPVDEHYTARIGRETLKINFGDYLAFNQVNDNEKAIVFIAFFCGRTDWKQETV
ncbi:MAG: hypothetical protein GC164_12310 [Phycisphaera sp.]|nr:hypothetical protein [Phycisphaera sp.]